MNFKGCRRMIRRSVVQGVDNVEVIFHRQVIYNERCPPGTWLDFYAVPINRNRPEQTVIKTQIKVVHLIAEVGGWPPHVEVDSNERKGALMVAPICSDVFTGHEPHVRIKNKWRIRSRRNTSARPAAENLGRAECPIEVRNGGKLGRGPRQVYMKNMTIAKKIESAGNRVWQSLFRGSAKHRWNRQSGSQRRAGLKKTTS